jgi:hypothetical protein
MNINMKRLQFWTGRNTPHYFHPSICPCQEGLLMTMQTFEESDTYGPVMYSISSDEGNNWKQPQPVPALKHRFLKNGLTQGIADVRSEYHAKTQTVITIGSAIYYQHGKNIDCNPEIEKCPPQFPVYAIRYPDASWSERKRLKYPFFEDCDIWYTACVQISIMPNGNLLLPIYFRKSFLDKSYSVCSALCSYDGEDITIQTISNVLSSNIGNGLMEPSIVYYQGQYYMTIRSPDGYGYFSISADGLNWETRKQWCWEDEMTLAMSSTQQHWLLLQNKLFLVYTRKTEYNQNVFNWRTPLFMAEFDPNNNCLLKHTEKIVMPLEQHNNIPNRLGNFHVANISPTLSFISDASWWGQIDTHGKVVDHKILDYNTNVWVTKLTCI